MGKREERAALPSSLFRRLHDAVGDLEQGVQVVEVGRPLGAGPAVEQLHRATEPDVVPDRLEDLARGGPRGQVAEAVDVGGQVEELVGDAGVVDALGCLGDLVAGTAPAQPLVDPVGEPAARAPPDEEVEE